MKQTFRSGPAIVLATGLLVSLSIIGVRAIRWLEPIELAVYDRYLRLRPVASAVDSRIAIVQYTEEDIQRQRQFPLSDATLTAALERILDEGPRAVGVDLYRDVPVPPGSDELDALLLREPRVIMINRFPDDGLLAVAAPAVLVGTEQVGFSDLKLDADQRVRRGILYQDDEVSGLGLSLSLRVALLWLEQAGIGLGVDPDDPNALRLGDTTIGRFDSDDGGYAGADAGGFQYLLDFRAAPHPFPSLTIGGLLSGEYDPEILADRIVLLGVTAETHADYIHVPWGQWPGVELHGHMASQLVRYGLGETVPPHTLTQWLESGWIALWGLLGGLLGLRAHRVWSFVAGALAGVGAVAGAGFGALVAGWWIPSAPPALAWLSSAAVVTALVSHRERSERAVLMQIFSQHVNEKVAQMLWEERDAFLDGGRLRPQRVTATTLFADLKGSTVQGEKLEPADFMSWLNDFMDAMASEVLEQGGIVDDYFGDGLKADFGVLPPRASDAEIDADARAAVRCALAMERRLRELNASWRERGMPSAAMRVGISTGEVLVGSIGSREKLKYTVVGDVVQVAARLESFDQSHHDFDRRPCRILVAEATRARLGGSMRTRELGQFTVKGKEEPVLVHEVLGPAPPEAGDRAGEA